MAISFIQSKSNFANGAVSTLAATPTSAIVSGRLLVVSIFWIGPTAPAALTDISTLTDTLSTSYTNAVFAAGSNGVDTHWGLTTYTGVAPSGGSDTVTVNFAAAVTFSRIYVTEVAGAGTAPVDKTATAFGANTAPDSGAQVPTVNNELIYGFCQTGNTCTISAGTAVAFTLRETTDAAVAPGASEDVVQGPAASVSVQFTLSTSQSWGCQMVTLKPRVGILFRGA